MDFEDFENHERFKKGLIFVGHNLEPYTRNGIKLVHQKIQTCLADNKPCLLKCSLTFGNNVRRWCKTCDNWRQNLLSFCSVPASVSWKKMESWKWPFDYTTISLVYLPGSWENHMVDFNDFSTACTLWKRCSVYKISPQIIKLMQQYTDKDRSIHGQRKVTNEEKQRVFYALEELFCHRDIENSLELYHEYYINELYKISDERKDQSNEVHQDTTKKITYLKTGKQQLRILSDPFYFRRIFLLLVFVSICCCVRCIYLYLSLPSYKKQDMFVLGEDLEFMPCIILAILAVAVAIFIVYLIKKHHQQNVYVTDLAEKLLSDYERIGMCKPWNPRRMLNGMFDFTLQHSFQTETKEIFKSALTIVSGKNVEESRSCIKDVLNIWSDTIRYRKKICNTKLTSGLAKFSLAFHIRVRRNEVIYNLHNFISEKIPDIKHLSASAKPHCEYLVLLDLNEGNIREPQKFHLQEIGLFKVLIFVNDLKVVAERPPGIERLSCSELLAQCGELTKLFISRRKGIIQNYMQSESNDCVMKHLSEEVNNVLLLRSFQCESATKLFDIIFKDIRSPNSFISAEIHLRNFYKNRQSYVRNLVLINCDSSVLFIHPAEKVLQEGYHLDNLLVSNCKLCFPRCANLKTVVFSDLIIGRKKISITLSENEIKQFKFFTRMHNIILEIFMPHFGNATSFDKEDFCIENQRSNTIGKTVILNQICHRLVDYDPCIAEAYAALGKDDSVIIVGLTRDLPATCQSLKVFRDFTVEFRPYYPSSKISLRAENSFESNEVLDKDFSKQLFAINETVSFHSEKLIEQHSNLEAVKVSLVHVTDENCIKACLCVVLYCRCKSFIPYGESPFPSYLKHPVEDIIFPTNVREGYFISCTGGNVMAGFAKCWNKELAMGCSIGPENENFSATCGPFVSVKETGETCFLTVRHLFQPLSKPDQQVIGTKIVQPADGDIIPSQAFVIPNPVAAGGTGQQHGSNTSVRRCGEVIASALSETVDAALVKIDDSRVPTRGNYVNVTRDDLHFAGFSSDNLPTYDNGNTLDARFLTVTNHATDRVIKFGKETGLRKGTLRLSSMAVKEVICAGSVQFNGRPSTHNLKNQLQIDSYAVSAFFQRGDSGSAVFLVDKDNKLYCIGMAIGVMSDLTAVVTPVQNILHELGRRLGKTLEMKKFEFEKMDES